MANAGRVEKEINSSLARCVLAFRWLVLVVILLSNERSLAAEISASQRDSINHKFSELQDEMVGALAEGNQEEGERLNNEIIDLLLPYQSDQIFSSTLIHRLNQRASTAASSGKWQSAEADLLLALNLAKKIDSKDDFGDRESHLFGAYRTLAEFYLSAGNLKRAYQGYDAAKYFRRESDRKRKEAILRNASGTNMTAEMIQRSLSRSVGTGLSIAWSEGNFLKRLGNLSEAEEALEAELQLLEENWRLNEEERKSVSNFSSVAAQYHRSRALSLIDLAEIAISRGNQEAAYEFGQRIVEIADEAISMLQSNPTDLTGLDADEMAKMGATPAAIEEMKATMAKLEQVTKLATSEETKFFYYLKYVRIAEIFYSTGNVEEASVLLSEGLRRPEVAESVSTSRGLLFPGWSIEPERVWTLKGDIAASLKQHSEAGSAYEKALSVAKDTHPENSPVIQGIQLRIALLNAFANSEAVDETLVIQIIEGYLKNLSEVLEFGSVEQRLAYRSTFDPLGYFATFDLSKALADTVTRTKGLVLESILDDQRRLDEASRAGKGEVVGRLERLRRKLMEVSMTGGKQAKIQSDQIQREVALLQDELRDSVEERFAGLNALQLTHTPLVNALGKNRVLLDIIRYQHYVSPGESTTHYGALVYRADEEPVFVKLGSAKEADRLVEEYMRACRSATDTEIEESVRELSQLLIKPFEPFLGSEKERILISPDGSLSFLSFGTLLKSDGSFLIEQHEVHYLTNSRRLLDSDKTLRKESAVIVANPNFDEQFQAVEGGERSSSESTYFLRGALQGLKLAPLPGTELEEEILRPILADSWNWEVKSYTREEASESALASLESPGILHLATHGFFLPGSTSGYSDDYRYDSEGGRSLALKSPMHRGGLALSGANKTLERWDNGDVVDTSTDGILSAAELAEMELDETWLVVLSACDTGVGEAAAGEGVRGIRYGLFQAGAEHLLLTLWPVADEETVAFMSSFYEALDLGKEDPVAALAEAQAEMLKQIRDAHGLAHAVRIAGPFVMSR